MNRAYHPWQIHRPNCLKIFQLHNKVAEVETKVVAPWTEYYTNYRAKLNI